MTLAFSIWMYAQGHASCKVYVHLDVAVKNERSVRACNSPVCIQCGCWSQNLGVTQEILLRVAQSKEACLAAACLGSAMNSVFCRCGNSESYHL